jgi:ATP-dependent RNA helicase RhlB
MSENHHLTETRFDELNLPEQLSLSIKQQGFEYCTPIQASSLPIAIQGKDVSGQAQTGTGKTIAFLVATLNKLITSEAKTTDKKNPIRALILAPTRELAIQIFEDGEPLIKGTDLKMGIAYGGTDYEKQRKHIDKGVDILVGTPGRVIDYFKQNVFTLNALEVAVLDEADRMFDLGFISDIRYLFRNMPEPSQRLNLLFSATLSHRVAELAYEHMNEPQEVKIESETITAERIQEMAFMPSNSEKMPLLIGLLKQALDQKTVVFVNTKNAAERIQIWLTENNLQAALLSGDVPQKKRERLLNEFKQGKCSILIATDVAARGLHIPDVTTVINYDLPTDAEDYVHRIGRTARAGASGTAISLVCETYAMNLMSIEEYIERSLPIEKGHDALMPQDLKEPDASLLENIGRRKTDKTKRQEKPAQRNFEDKQNDDIREAKKSQSSKRKRKEPADLESPEAKDAKTLAAKTKHQKKRAKTALRGRRNFEVPAVG